MTGRSHRIRHGKDRDAARKEILQANVKLGNEAFSAKAPDDVVAKIRGRPAEAEADVTRLTAQLDALAKP